MDEAVKEELVAKFRNYLDTDFTEESSPGEIDLFSLFNELAGLKNEVKIESRQLKTALNDFHQAFTSLDSRQQELIALLNNQNHKEHETDPGESMILLLGLIDLYDRLRSGLKQELPTLSFFERLVPTKRQNRKWLKAYLEGQQMLLNRIVDLLRQCEVTPIDAEGEQFDPQLMQAVGVKFDRNHREGIVTQEFRKGFRRNTFTVRQAEVVVNKREETT